MSKLPILVLAFNRADHVAEAMKAIRRYRPERLYLECDGPRPSKPGDAASVAETRRTMLEAVDWPCEVKTLFRDENLGCAHAVNDAVSWFFSQEEYGCIIEDDVIVGDDFFTLCEDLLPRYASEERVMEISAWNNSRRRDISDTYVYSLCYHCWGWASWSRAWKYMDMTMSAVEHLSICRLISRLGLFQGAMMYYYFRSAYRHLESFNSWATRWFLSIYENDGLVICPGVNLSKNIGFRSGAHYSADDADIYSDLEIGRIQWPLKYNDIIAQDPLQKRYDIRDFYRKRYFGLLKKIIGK